jgi:hypothetical protein
MLRIIVISLIVANVLLLGFQASQSPTKEENTGSSIKAGRDDIPTIHLFSELMQDQDLMTGSRQCFTLGPFHDIEDMRGVRDRLQDISRSTSERETQAMVEKGYWVYLPPYRSLLEANEVLFALQALGLQDIGVIYNGERKNSISLGYFLRQENANKRKKGLQTKGYKPLMRVQRQAEPRYWLDYEQNPGSDLIALDMQNRANDFMQRGLPCPEQVPLETTVADVQAIAESEASTSTENVAQDSTVNDPEEG